MVWGSRGRARNGDIEMRHASCAGMEEAVEKEHPHRRSDRRLRRYAERVLGKLRDVGRWTEQGCRPCEEVWTPEDRKSRGMGDVERWGRGKTDSQLSDAGIGDDAGVVLIGGINRRVKLVSERRLPRKTPRESNVEDGCGLGVGCGADG